MNVRVEDLKSLPLRERLRFVEDLWDSIAEELQKAPASEELKREMERRRDACLRNPDSAVDWDVVRRQLEDRN